MALQIRWADTMVSLHVENVAYYPDVLNDMGKQVGEMFRQALSDVSDYAEVTLGIDGEEYEEESEDAANEASD
jgi:hypothetical protein